MRHTTTLKNNSPLLYVILTYFNYCKSKRRQQLFLEFVERMKSNRGIKIVVVEATYQNDAYDLPSRISGVSQHIGFRVKDRIWLKENLINLAVQRLPKDWNVMAWIDADITFLNTEWVQETLRALELNDVLQLFQTCIQMGPDGEAVKIDHGFGYTHAQSVIVPTSAYGTAWHPGFAWAMTKSAYMQMGGLVDFAILGSGDRHMALAWIGKVTSSHPGCVSKNYAAELLEFQKRCAGLRLGYIRGTILHHYHGKLENRQYQKRWSILTNGVYMPRLDIQKNENGLIELTKRGERFAAAISNYFVERKEDE